MTQLFFAEHVTRGLVGKDQRLPVQFFPVRQPPQYGQKWRDAGAAGNEDTEPLVADGAERLGHQQLGARLQLMERLRHAGVFRIGFDGEFEHPVGNQTGGREGSSLFAQAGQIDRQFDALAGIDGKPLRLTDDEALHVMGDELTH